MTPEQTLWQTVVFQAAIDATAEIPEPHPLPEHGAPKKEWNKYRARLNHITSATRLRDECDRWFRRAGKDFRKVCSLAGIDPDFISNAYVAGKIDRDRLKRAVEGSE